MINQMLKFKFYLVIWFCINALATTGLGGEEEEGTDVWDLGRPFVKIEERRSIVSTENGEISGARVSDGNNGFYLLHFITLEPNSLFLPVLLHADMVFYVHSGTGSLGWNEEDEMRHANVKKGDVYRLPGGTVFFAQSSLESERQKLRIHAIFANSISDLREPIAAPYTSISDLVLGFDKDVLQAAFSVPESVIEEMLHGTKQPAFIHGQPQTEQTLAMWDKQMEYVKQLVGKRGLIMSVINKKKKDKEEKMYNIIEEDKDFENFNGWSSTVTSKNLDALKGSDIGIFMVNLTKGSMVGPHWNPMATEIAIALQGQGIVRVVCPKTSGNVAECRDMRFHVNEGDVFVVPRFHPMAQMAFNNGSFVFMGFSTSAKNNHPQFLAGKASVLRTLNVDVVAASFNVANTTITQLLDAQDESVILECVTCAEEELRVMQEEMEREMEERRKREEEEARKAEEQRRREEEEEKEREEEMARKEEEARKEREEEEARRKEEEEESKRREKEEEEQRRKEEEAQKEEEEEAARREEEERRQKEEEEARRKEEEEERKEQEEQRREEEQRKQEEEAQRKEEEEAQREEEERKQIEEEEARRKEEEERKRQEEERREEEEVAKREEQRRQEEEAQRKEEAAQREEEERRQREEQEAKRREKEARKKEEEREAEQRRQEEEARRKEEVAQREEEERRQREEEEVRRREKEARKREEEREAQRQREKEAAQEEQERARRAEEAARRAAEEAERRASEEAERAAKEEQERERRQREPEVGGSGIL